MPAAVRAAMKVARFFSLVACVAGFGFFDGEGMRVAETTSTTKNHGTTTTKYDAGVAAGGGGPATPAPANGASTSTSTRTWPAGGGDTAFGDARPAPAPAPPAPPAPTYSPTPVDPNETCESKIARGADLTCSACCPNECAKFEDTDVADAYKTLNDADAYFSTYTYDFRGHDGCVCFNDKSFNSDYGSVHLTEGNDCALVVSSADVHGLGGDDTLIVDSIWGNSNIYGGAGDDHVKVLYGFGGWEDDDFTSYYDIWDDLNADDATRVEGGDGEDSVVIYKGGAIVDGDVETLTSYAGECAETGEEPGERRCEYDY
mmetsp:Transcript_5119/g.17418  ORF Transcript_5119/g.17418 Transcript_5119/m.17418 type:complete len:316 (+) Transcript_5119:251-1198(+)